MALSPFYITGAALVDGSLNLETDTFYAALFAGSLTPAAGNSQWSDWSASQISTSGDYNGPVDVANPTLTGSGKSRTWDTDNISFGSNVSISAKYLGVFKGDESSPQNGDLFVGWVDMNADQADITAISKANPAQVTAAGHGFSTGDTVALLRTDLREAERLIATITVVDANNFTLDSTDLSGAIGNAGTTGKAVKLNNTDEGSSVDGNFQVQAPSGGWVVIG